MVVILFLLDLAIVWSSPAVGDWYQFWWAGHVVATGGSPYDPNVWAQAAQGPEFVGGAINIMRASCAPIQPHECLWLYPPWAALLFAPFGALPAETGIALLRVTLLVTGGIAIVMLVRETGLRPAMPLAAAVALTSQPLLLATRTGHFDALLIIGALLLRRGLDGSTRWLVAGVLLLSLKPHLVLALGVVTVMLLVRRGRARQLATAAAIVGMVAAVSTVLYPLPGLSALLAESADKTEYGSPTTWLLARGLGGAAWPLLAIVLVAISAAAAAVASRATTGRRDGALVAAGLGLSLVIAPYEHVHDHALLLPAATLAIATGVSIPHPWPRAVTLAIVVTAAVAYPWVAFFWGLVNTSALLDAVVPLAVLGAFALAVALARQARPGFRPAEASSARPTGSSP